MKLWISLYIENCIGFHGKSAGSQTFSFTIFYDFLRFMIKHRRSHRDSGWEQGGTSMVITILISCMFLKIIIKNFIPDTYS